MFTKLRSKLVLAALGVLGLHVSFACPTLFADWRTTQNGTKLWEPINMPGTTCVWTGDQTARGYAAGTGLIIYAKNNQIACALLCDMNNGVPQGTVLGVCFSESETTSKGQLGRKQPPLHTSEGDPLAGLRQLVEQLESANQPTAAQRPPVGRPSVRPQPTPAPMPQPNYTWLYGARYTPTAMAEYRLWLSQQSYLSEAEKQSRYDSQERANRDDAQRESDWIERAFGSRF